MKKLLAMLLALTLALAGATAFADTVYTRVTIDSEAVTAMLPGFGVPEEQLGMVEPILALVNALGVNVITADDGAQVDLDLNGAQAISLGWTLDDAGANIVSTLFPNYYVTLSSETIASMLEQIAANMPAVGGDGDGGMDMTAVTQVFSGYVSRYMEAVSSAASIGEPEEGAFEIEGYTFDTKVPVTVDIPTIVTATDALVDEMLADEAVVTMLQTSMAYSGQTFDVDDFRAGYEEWKTHMPEEATAEFYGVSDDAEVFYITGDAFLEGKEEASYHYDMLNKGSGDISMGYWDYETGMTITFDYAEGAMSSVFTMGDMYFGFNLTTEAGKIGCELYFMNADAPLIRVDVATAEGGERTLAVDPEGKTVLAVEDVMADGNSEAAQGLYADVQANGLGALLGVAMQQVPELGSLMGMAS